ncbi:MAG TPA: amidophosphoribosyltransferase [Lachnospiraceae bacterium]|nr:amidophosphoribosyltransferase [Lachnospiraceae bacterium]HBY72321.1 amidophosphoribosyltransferase [Lachnospiraceae bacterium]HCA70615.1 amidophosphoribosyltransferase [Lachnospiraceae bacterium]HCM13399.1 amidophosphoribosyltransferase [Lachnospiraceae bacterium]HCR39999.1 amidophosphoribosyltransferase [Lachnospiraceae bacterium]
MFQTILDMIYPPRCPICGKIIIPKKNKICDPCRAKLQYITEPRCKKCSKPIEQEEKEFCSDCERRDFHFTKGYAVWIYDEAMKRSIAGFKYYNKREYADFYIEELLRIYGDKIRKFSPDAIVPIPLHRSKYRARGYNQADVLACGLGKGLHYPVLSNLLVRNKKTLPQKQLSDRERLRNLQEAFAYNKTVAVRFHKELDRILLVDDIFTTGSTIEACTNVLISNGVKDIRFITLCIGRGY